MFKITAQEKQFILARRKAVAVKKFDENDFVLVENRKAIKYITAPKSGKAPSNTNFTSSKGQELMTIKRAIKIGIKVDLTKLAE